LDGCCQMNPGLLAEGLDGNVYGTNPSELSSLSHNPPIPGDGVLIGYSPATGAWARYYFQGGADGYSPLSGVTLGVDGNLYGATEWGGNTAAVGSGYGTVFSFTPGVSASPVHIYEFTKTKNASGSIDGAYPWAHTVQTQAGMNGTGTTGQGTVFRVGRDGSSFSTIYEFQDNANEQDGYCPTAGLVQGNDGLLYGVTSAGGGGSNTAIAGTLFRLDTGGGNFQVLHRFDKPNGYSPLSTPLLHTNGKIYGMTMAGGSGYGVLYSYDPGLGQ